MSGQQPELALGEPSGTERAVFGGLVSTEEIHTFLDDYARQQLGSRIAHIRFRAGRIDAVWGVELADGRGVVIKTHRPPADLEDLRAAADAQQLLVAARFPCPTPLSGPDAVHGRVVTAETLLDGSTPDGRDPVNRRLLADGLARHIHLRLSQLRKLSAPSSSALGRVWCPPTASAAALVAVLTAMVTQTEVLAGQVKQGFGQHPDVEVYRSQPGLGAILGARVLAEFGDDPTRYADAKARKNYSGMSPITRASGTKRVVLARYARNRRLGDALFLQAQSALRASPGARAHYDQHRTRGATHYQALRTLASRLVGILHGCLRHHTLYDEHLAWHTQSQHNLAA